MPTTVPGVPTFQQLEPPADGEAITFDGNKLTVPDAPIIPFIEGDGTGPDIWRASRQVLDGAVRIAYGGARRLAWFEVYAGEKSKARFDSWLPDDTLAAIRHYLVAIKGPLTTPVGGGSARSTWHCASNSISMPVSGRCGGSPVFPLRSRIPPRWTW